MDKRITVKNRIFLAVTETAKDLYRLGFMEKQGLDIIYSKFSDVTDGNENYSNNLPHSQLSSN